MPELLHEPDLHFESLNLQTVACLGPENSYSHLLTEVVAPDAELVLTKSFASLATTLLHNPDMAGIVPVQNLINGDVYPVMEWIRRGGFWVLGEATMPIHLVLAARTHNKRIINLFYSHHQALGQSRQYSAKYPDIEGVEPFELDFIETESTSEAARIVSGLGGTATEAAICSKRAAARYGLNILEENIEDNKDNATRFLVIQSRAGNSRPHLDSLLPHKDKAKHVDNIVESRVACIVDTDIAIAGLNRFLDFTFAEGLYLPNKHFVDDFEKKISKGFVEMTADSGTLHRIHKQLDDLKVDGITVDILGAYPIGAVYEPK